MTIQQLKHYPTALEGAMSGLGEGIKKGLPRMIDNKKISRALEDQDISNDPQAYIDALMKSGASKEAIEKKLKGVEMVKELQKQQRNSDLEREKFEYTKSQDDASNILKTRKQQFDEDTLKDKQNTGKGAITLNEQLGRLKDRTEATIKDMIRPFEKPDEFGATFLNFDKDDGKRKEVLSKIDKERERAAKVTKRLYEKVGEEVPQDVLDIIEGADISFPDKNGKNISLKTHNFIDTFSTKFPAKKYKGKTATDPETGMIIRSDGADWTIIEED